MNKLDYAIIFVSDMARSIQFYRDTLGLPLKFESPSWTEFATDGCTVALHLSEARKNAEEQSPCVAGRCQPGFQVADIDSFHQNMLAKGVTCLQAPKLEKFGMKLAAYADPDGLTITVVQPTQGRNR